MTGWFKDKEHLVRMAGLFGIGFVVFFLLQHFLVPPGFGTYGHYRAGALDDNRARPISYAGRAACENCHSDVAEARKGSRHERIACEACHGPMAKHADEPTVANATRPNGRALCIGCHEALPARPTSFPQVNVADHADQGPCTACHKPHAPAIS